LASSSESRRSSSARSTSVRGRVAGDRVRVETGADRGQSPVGEPAPAGLRDRPARVSHLPPRDADGRLHHPAIGDRPDPRAPPHPRLPCGARDPRRREEPPIDAGPREPGGVTRPTSVGRRPDRPLSTAPPPRRHAGTFGVGGGPTGATDGPPPASLPPRCPPFPRPSRRANQSAGTPMPVRRCSRGR
jgi:hypothetical protein